VRPRSGGQSVMGRHFTGGRNNGQGEMVRGNPERSARRTYSIGGTPALPARRSLWIGLGNSSAPAPSRHLNELVRINGGCPAAIDALPGMIAEKMRRVTQRANTDWRSYTACRCCDNLGPSLHRRRLR
jgi:hypothetical protein